MTNPTQAFIFYAVTLALAVAVALAVPFIGEASLPVTMLTPTIAAAIMLTFVSREGGFRDVLSLLGLDRAGLKGWPLAIAAPAAIHLVGLVFLSAAGLAVFAAPSMPDSMGTAIPDVLAGLVIGTLFALGEEIGWRGYMLPRLLGFGVVPAMLIAGFLHGVWHLPIMLTTEYYHSTGNPWLVVPLFLVTLSLAGIFYGYLRIWTGSVWPVAIAHSTGNMAWGIMNKITQTKSPLVLEYIGGESGMIVIGGLLVLSFFIIRYMKSGRFKPALAE
ncbi:MAG: type II CAAX endopeptidase family protein [Aestuariivirga sp.]